LQNKTAELSTKAKVFGCLIRRIQPHKGFEPGGTPENFCLTLYFCQSDFPNEWSFLSKTCQKIHFVENDSRYAALNSTFETSIKKHLKIMSLIQLISLLRKNLWVIVILPVVTAVAIFFLTRNEKREYNANTLIYTGLASGYTLESGQNSRTDYFATNNAFDNLINIVKSRSTLEEVGIRLLASHLMLRQPTAAVANGATFEHLQQTIPNDVLTQVVDYHSAERTVENIYRYSQIPKNIIAEKLLNAKESPYSVKGILAKLTVNREGTSDMMRISYLAEDPAVVKQTLELVTSVFMRRYREVKVSETGNVVNYFE
jgi:capsular polysaccharide biosynthesis protein